VETAPAPRLRLGKYQLVRHLATGGMAEVILARVRGIEGFERHVVIKKIRDENARDRRFVQMFLDEARLAASLHHHNIVHVHDIGQDDGEYFFTMEYVHGEDLRRLLAHMAEHDRQVPLDHCVTIALATAAALHHAHEHRGPDRKVAGIVHRDVSPANILVAYDGNVKVVDFGIAKVAQRVDESGLMKGKVAYMSPEQVRGHGVDRRSDIFCLGIVLYELVTVQRLFKGANDVLTMSAIKHGMIPRPSELRPELPPELEAIILKALATSPADRYQTADEMRAALERFAAAAKLQTSTTALADFMRAELGPREVPWLAADDDEVELSVAPPGPAPEEEAAPPPAGAPSPEELAPPAGSASASMPTMSTARALSPSMAPPLGTPPGSASRRRGLVLAAAGAAAAALVLVVLAATAGSPGSAAPPASRAVTPVIGPEERAEDRPSSIAEPAAPVPAAVAPAPATAPAAPAPEVADPPAPPAADDATVEKKPARPGKRPASPRRLPKGVWDPKALLPPR
jgi:serine/threonine-protein kinase